jgi:Zn finger protein HypA/HybF involved in hydrogenase expression
MPLSRKRAWLRAPALSFAPSILMDMSDPTACCVDCGTPREIPVDGEKTCAVCGSPNVSLRDSDEATMHELVALKARDDEPEMSEPVVACKNCGAELNESASAPVEDRQPCPECGSLGRHVSLTLEGKVALRSSLGLKAKSGGRGKPFMELKQGDNFSTSHGRWMRLLQIVDRRNNRYRKLVTDPETGAVVRDVDERLTEHTGRGDARRKQ